MLIKKLLRILFLIPIIPLIGTPTDGEGTALEGGKDDGSSEDSENHEGEKNKEKKLEFSKEDVEEMFSTRVGREKKRLEKEYAKKYEEDKRKANLSENEKLKEEKEEAIKKANETLSQANKRLIRSEVIKEAVSLNIVDSDAAYKLMDKDSIEVDESGKVTGVKESLDELIKNKTYLVKSSGEETSSTSTTSIGDDQQGKTKKGGNYSINSLIRKSIGR